MNDDKKIMNIIAQAYQIIAKASNQEPTREGLQQVLEMLGEDGIKQCVETADEGPEAVAEAMIQILKQKQARMAANGAKLQYLQQLKGKCPQGYLKHGGRCKPCEKQAGVFNNRADLLNDGGNVNWKKEQEKLLTPKNQNNKTDKKDNKDIKKLPKLGEPKKQQDNKEMYDDMRQRQKRKLMARNGGILKFQGGGPTISDYRRRQQELRRQAYEKALTTEEGVPTGPSFTLRGTSNSPIRLQGVAVTTPARPEYHRQRGRDGGYHEWISPYGSPGNIDLTDPSNLIGPYRYTTSNGRTTYYRYDSPDRFTPMSSRQGERQFNRAKRKSAPAKEQEGGSLMNRMWGAVSGEGVNGKGTRFNPVELQGVDVYGKPVRASKHTNYTWFYTNYPHRTSTDYLRYPGGTVYARTVEASPFRNDTTYNVWSKNGQTYLLTGSDFDEGIKNAQRDYGHPYSTNQAPRLKDRGKPIHGKPEY